MAPTPCRRGVWACVLLGGASFTAPQVAKEGLRVRVGVSYDFEEEIIS